MTERKTKEEILRNVDGWISNDEPVFEAMDKWSAQQNSTLLELVAAQDRKIEMLNRSKIFSSEEEYDKHCEELYELNNKISLLKSQL